MSLKNLLVIVFAASVITSCKKDDDTSQPSDVTYDRTEMLSYFSDSLIVYNYKNAWAAASALTDNVAQLKANTSAAAVTDFREQFEKVYLSWQLIAHLEFGPADNIGLKGNVNVYPTDTVQINKNIELENYNLGTADNTDAKGLPAISYLLYGTGNSAEEVAAYFADNPKAINYIEVVIDDYINKISGIYNNWKDTYHAEFKSRKGTDAGSSTSLLFNGLVLHTERFLRDGKIGIPAGKRTLGETLPEKTENYYSGKSMPLAVANLKAIYRFFSATEKVSFYHYLHTLNAKYNGQLLADVVDAQFKTAIDKLEAIPDPLSTTVDTNLPVIDAAYAEIQKLIVLLKTDVPSALGVLINYQDNDGD